MLSVLTSALSSTSSPPPGAKSLSQKASAFQQKHCCRGFRRTRPRYCACGCWRVARSEASLQSWGSTPCPSAAMKKPPCRRCGSSWAQRQPGPGNRPLVIPAPLDRQHGGSQVWREGPAPDRGVSRPALQCIIQTRIEPISQTILNFILLTMNSVKLNI